MCICTYIPLLNPKASALCFSFFILFYGRQSFQLQFLATAAACDVTNTHIQGLENGVGFIQKRGGHRRLRGRGWLREMCKLLLHFGHV